tara:strand:+ start:421 stop:657 length:237 start_codon:yes stop_codon:yes gene_type:complete
LRSVDDSTGLKKEPGDFEGGSDILILVLLSDKLSKRFVEDGVANSDGLSVGVIAKTPGFDCGVVILELIYYINLEYYY